MTYLYHITFELKTWSQFKQGIHCHFLTKWTCLPLKYPEKRDYMLLLKPDHIRAFCVCWHEATRILTLITPLSALVKETCILPMSCNSRCFPDKALIVSAQLSVKGASPCPRSAAEQTDLSPLGATAVFARRPHSSYMQHRSAPASSHNNPCLHFLPRVIHLQKTVFYIHALDVDVDIVTV